MALGIPAIVIGGGGKTGGFHALSEWIDLTDAWKGPRPRWSRCWGWWGYKV